MAIHKLNSRKILSAKPGKYEDGGGLRFVVSQAGAKRWVLRYTLRGNRHEMGLGSFPDIGLSLARQKAREYRLLASENVDPIAARRTDKVNTPTFTTCAAQYIRQHRHAWKNKKHARQWVSTLKTYVRPVIGNHPVDQITTEDILLILTPIWNSKTETAKRIQGRIENILDYASAHEYKDALNPARWRGHLDKLLPRPSKIKKVIHYPAMPYLEAPAFMAELSQKQGVSVRALEFMILTATRTNEVINARWHEINLKDALWVIPSERMKAAREHRVPLSTQALKIIERLPRLTGDPFLFPGFRAGKPLSNMVMLKVMRDMGYGIRGTRAHYVPHGFRSCFRDWAGEVSNYPSDVAEMALAHSIKNKAEAAYRRGDLLQKRAHMMQDWADYLSSL